MGKWCLKRVVGSIGLLLGEMVGGILMDMILLYEVVIYYIYHPSNNYNSS